MGLTEWLFGESNSPMDTYVAKAAKENLSSKQFSVYKNILREVMEDRETFYQHVGSEGAFHNPSRKDVEKIAKNVYFHEIMPYRTRDAEFGVSSKDDEKNLSYFLNSSSSETV